MSFFFVLLFSFRLIVFAIIGIDLDRFIRSIVAVNFRFHLHFLINILFNCNINNNNENKMTLINANKNLFSSEDFVCAYRFVIVFSDEQRKRINKIDCSQISKF